MSFLNTKVVLFVVMIVSVIVWLLVARKKNPKAADGRPGPVSNITTNPVAPKNESGTTEKYTDTESLNKSGLVVNFKTPENSGVVGDPTIKEYIIHLYLVDGTSTSAVTYLVEESLVAYENFTAGVDEPTFKYYYWKTGKNGKDAGGNDAEIFIDSQLIATLEDGKSYKIGIKAVNNKDVSSADEIFSPLIMYSKCAAGKLNACGWDSSGANEEVGYEQVILLPATISFGTNLSAGASIIGTQEDGVPCRPAGWTTADNRLYKYKNKACTLTGCKDAGYWLKNGLCEKKAAANDPCTPVGESVAGKTYIYFNQVDENGTVITDGSGNPILLCDAVGTTDPRAQSCRSYRNLAATWTLPAGTKWGAAGQTTGCPIECVSDKKIATGTYSLTATDTTTPCTATRTCLADKAPANTFNGEWGTDGSSCDKICVSGKWGPNCSAVPAPAAPANTATLPAAATVYVFPAEFPKTLVSSPYVFGKGSIGYGIWRSDGTSATSQKLWEFSSISYTADGSLTIGIQKFIPSSTTISDFGVIDISSGFKYLTLNTDGTLTFSFDCKKTISFGLTSPKRITYTITAANIKNQYALALQVIPTLINI